MMVAAQSVHQRNPELCVVLEFVQLVRINHIAKSAGAHTPVEPKPPVPRAVSLVTRASVTAACTTGATISWAMRMPRSMVKSASPRLISNTFTSPR